METGSPVPEAIGREGRGRQKISPGANIPQEVPSSPSSTTTNTVSDPFLILSFTPNLKTCLCDINNHQGHRTQEQPIAGKND